MAKSELLNTCASWFGKRPWAAFGVIALIAMGLAPWKVDTGGTWPHLAVDLSNAGTVLAELLIAFVIYYEIEENRIAGFLHEVLDKPYKQRREIYEAYGKAKGVTWQERAQSFRDLIVSDVGLRSKVDYQLSYISNAHYLVRRSLLHQNLMTNWFPQTVVRLWAMLCEYVGGSERRGLELALETIKAVDAIGKLPRAVPIAIYADSWDERISLAAADLRKIRLSAETYLADCGEREFGK